MSDRFLTDDELADATGAVQKNLQAEILTQNGIFYIVRRDGSIRTTWYHINHPTHLSHIGSPSPGMNFGAIEG